MKDGINLRPAIAADVERLAHLWVLTFPKKFGPILGEQAERVICDWLRLSRRHLQTTTVAEINGIVAGYIVLETPSAPHADSGRWLWHAVQLHNGIFGALRSFLLIVLTDIGHQPESDEVYIEMLGVAPAWRGQGIGSKLIAYAEDVARSERASTLTLNVVSDNLVAVNLYKKSGFKLQRRHQSRTLKWITGHGNYYEMVKQLREA